MKKIDYCLFTKSVYLPFDGWLQVCYSCNSHVTGLLLLLEVIKNTEFIKNFKVYLCKECKQSFKFNNNTERDFETKCHIIMNEYLMTGRTESPLAAISVFEET